MASIFAFKTRSPDRDRQTDAVRFEHLLKTLGQLSGEIDAEKTGIRNRYEAVSANAAFLVEAMDNDAVSTRRAAEMDQLTEALKNCLRRVDTLGRQGEFVAGLRRLVDDFIADGRNADDAMPPARGEAAPAP
ncbi:hypothetical protein [Aminobacter sp. HY435]|uniref:hypothetical protein n=1 Tax=Aminobacter sp. HY435 TaxID=2970917 RepID=UPI0022B9420A|nr:hypothetical protein [Aminobacter sp. HY435]